MIDSSKFLEKFLQNYRFRKVRKYLNGDVLDFGGNNGELKSLVRGNYTLVNYDHSPMYGKEFDTIVLLAVIEHIDMSEVYALFRQFSRSLKQGGILFLTTPTPPAKYILELLAFARVLDKKNIDEHKHYWDKDDLLDLAQDCGLKVEKYQKFQMRLNQYCILKK